MKFFRFFSLVFFIAIAPSFSFGQIIKNLKVTKSLIPPKEIKQKDLFNIIRNGVVVINVNNHASIEYKYNKAGTGFIVDLKRGIIVTNSHVADDASVCDYEVKFGEGTKREAKLIYIDPCYDIALLWVDPAFFPKDCIELELSDDIDLVNTTVYAMGNTHENEFSTYQGTVFDVFSSFKLKNFSEQSIQFSGLTAGGASGSPVFDSQGKVVALLYGGQFVSGVALPIQYLKPILSAFKEGKTFNRFFCGFLLDYENVQDLEKVNFVPNGFDKQYEVDFPEAKQKVLFVRKKAAAFSDGDDIVQIGDVLLEAEGKKIGCYLQKFDDIVQSKQGGILRLKVFRKGKVVEVEAPTHLVVPPKKRLLSFLDTVFFETTLDIKMEKGHKENAVYISSKDSNSFLIKTGALFCCLTELNGTSIKALDDVLKVIPSILEKDYINFKYKKFDDDAAEGIAVVRYNPEFCEATYYEYDYPNKNWSVTKIKNPSQKLLENDLKKKEFKGHEESEVAMPTLSKSKDNTKAES